jgi:hypothetical protein
VVTHIRGHEHDERATPAVEGIGPWGWLGVFALFLVAVLLVAYF